MADDGDGDVLRGGGGVYVPRIILFTGSLVGTAVIADLARHGSLITQYFHHFTFIGLALVTIVVIGEKPGLSSYLTHIDITYTYFEEILHLIFKAEPFTHQVQVRPFDLQRNLSNETVFKYHGHNLLASVMVVHKTLRCTREQP